jgi:hypothetical protein
VFTSAGSPLPLIPSGTPDRQDPPMTESARPRRPRLALSVRLLMLLMIPVAVWLAWVTNKARRQREAVAAVIKSGGWVRYDWEFINGCYSPGLKPAAPEWLRRLVGDEFHQEVETAGLVGPIDEAVTAHLASMSRLRYLSLSHIYIKESCFEKIGRLTRLEELDIMLATGLEGPGASHLAKLRNLKVLRIVNSGLTDSGLEHLGALPELEYLHINVNPVTDRGLELLKRMTKLKGLWIDGTGTTDEGVKKLREAMPSLTIEVPYRTRGPGSRTARRPSHRAASLRRRSFICLPR